MTGDEAYGQDPRLRAAPEARGTGYVPAVACSTRIRISHGRTPVRADTVAGHLPGAARHRQSAGNGAKGPRHYDWAWIRIDTAADADKHHQLLIRRNRTTRELAFYLCRSPTAAPWPNSPMWPASAGASKNASRPPRDKSARITAR
ncbi:hypothetical protein ACGF8B_38090 [Streptomyces sp. NPDC047917]|uniref:hypothetical protein n=1 Tax=Streptomyces sp. NPDC047917 TaxID=3365491 RepID=UPI0037226999